MAEEGYNRIKETRHGRMVYNINDQFVGRAFDQYGEFSDGEMHLLQRYVRPGDIVIDVGANIGALTVPLAKLTHPGGVVFAFEPQRLVYQTLCANVAINSIVNAFCYQQAVGEKLGAIRVPTLDPTRPQNFGGVELGGETEGETVPVITLDQIPFNRCNLVKIDVEGMEKHVLRGGRNFIRRHQPVLYIENDRKEHSDELLMTVRSLGYHAYWHLPPMYNPENFAGNLQNIWDDMISRNMLCVPVSQAVPDLMSVDMP